MQTNLRRAALGGLVMVWLVTVCTGIGALLSYANAAIDSGPITLRWPEGSRIRLDHENRATLVVFLHPRCPCSRATVSELDRIMARVGPRVKTYAVFVRPEGFSEKEVQGELWQRVQRIQGVDVIADESGDEARRFGATLSGHLFAFNPLGELSYSGGITSARGHEGDNEGSESVVSLARTGHATVATRPALGCGLFNRKTLADEPGEIRAGAR